MQIASLTQITSRSMPRPKLYRTPEEKKLAKQAKNRRHYAKYAFFHMVCLSCP